MENITEGSGFSICLNFQIKWTWAQFLTRFPEELHLEIWCSASQSLLQHFLRLSSFKWEGARMKFGCQRTCSSSSVHSPPASALLSFPTFVFYRCCFPEASFNKVVMTQAYFGWSRVCSLGLIIAKSSSSSSLSSLLSLAPFPLLALPSGLIQFNSV